MRLSRRRGAALAVGLLVAADWASKGLVATGIGLGRPLVDGWLSLELRRNPGITLGSLSSLPDPWRTGLLAAATLFGIAMCARLLAASADVRVKWAAALVMAGAVGNLGDRLMDGGVTDFIYVHFFPYIFNVADIAITIGGVLLVLRMLFDRPGDEPAPTHA